MPSFRRLDDEGRVEAIFEEGEVALLRSLPEQGRELLQLDGGDVSHRLFPRAYLDHAEEPAEEEWQRLMHADLLQGKLEALAAVEASLARGEPVRGGRVRVELESDETHAWLSALNDLRLAMGVMLEITDDLDIAGVDPSDPRAPGLHLYGWLTWVQGDLVEVVSGAG